MRPLRVVALAVLVVGCAADPNPGQPARPTGCLERRVAVGPFGDPEWGPHLGTALAGRLRERGFSVVSDPTAAELMVTGQLTMTPVERIRVGGLMRGWSGGYVKGLAPILSLQVARGPETVWQRLYQSDRPKDLDDYAKDAAERIADACRRQWRP